MHTKYKIFILMHFPLKVFGCRGSSSEHLRRNILYIHEKLLRRRGKQYTNKVSENKQQFASSFI